MLEVKQRRPVVELIRDGRYTARRLLHRLPQGEVFKAIADVALGFLRAVVRLGHLLLDHLVNQSDLLEAFLHFFLLLLALALHGMWNVEDVGHGSIQAVK